MLTENEVFIRDPIKAKCNVGEGLGVSLLVPIPPGLRLVLAKDQYGMIIFNIPPQEALRIADELVSAISAYSYYKENQHD